MDSSVQNLKQFTWGNAMANAVEYHVLWHQLDNDGNVEAVFASPKEDLYSEMLRHAEYVASLAEVGVKTKIVEGDAGVAVAFSTDILDGKTVASIREVTALVIGHPNKPFDKIHFTNLQDEHGRMAVASVGTEEWRSVPDVLTAEYQEEERS